MLFTRHRTFAICLTLLCFAVTAFGQVERKYDRFKDETTVTARIGNSPVDAEYRSVSWDVVIKFPGEQPPKEPVVGLILTTSSKYGLLNVGDLQLRGIIDGERITLGTFERVGVPYRGTLIETSALRMPFASLKKIGAGKLVEVKTGELEWKFSEAGLVIVRELVAVFEQSPKSSIASK